jgi:hypothetical protein
MAKGKRKKRKPGAGHQPAAVDVDSVLADIEDRLPALDGPDSGPLWGEIQRLFIKAKADPAQVANAIAGRDRQELQHILNVLRGLEVEAPPEKEEDLPEIPGDTLREAMKAFRKRLKLMRLDHESKLGRSPLTSGKDASFDSILPPEQYPPDVWKVLAHKGQLESTGRGFYKLPTQDQTF